MAIVVRQVWQGNLGEELNLLKQCAWEFPIVSIDTEFPDTVFSLDVPKQAFSSLSTDKHYSLMKANVDALNIIQLGLTLSDCHDNLPRFGSNFQYVWQFNFRDFNCDGDLHDPNSISLLRSQGIDFSINKKNGVHSQAFAWIFRNSGLSSPRTGRAWVTFHGLYDLGFLIKILTREPLPQDLKDFMKLVRHYFGMQVYDLKPIARVLGLHGGLEKVAKSLGLDRAAWKSHQAGSDSLLTMQAFFRLLMNRDGTTSLLLRFNYMLYGLTCNF